MTPAPRKEGPWTPELIELLAFIEHQRWADWHRYASNNWTEENIARWDRQMTTEYTCLTEKEKDSDRREVRRYLQTIQETLAPLLARAECAEKLAEACEALIQDWNASKEPIVKDALAAWDSIKKEEK